MKIFNKIVAEKQQQKKEYDENGCEYLTEWSSYQDSKYESSKGLNDSSYAGLDNILASI